MAGLREIVLAAAQTPDAYAETIRENYLALPGSVDTAVYTLAGEITQDAQTDFDRASALVRLSAKRLSLYTSAKHAAG